MDVSLVGKSLYDKENISFCLFEGWRASHVSLWIMGFRTISYLSRNNTIQIHNTVQRDWHY